MKMIWLLGLTLVASCGKVTLPESETLGESYSTDIKKIVMGSTEHQQITQICDAINTKSQTVSSLVNTNYVFGVTSKNCLDTGFGDLPDSNVTLVNQGGLYKFLEGSNLFYFADVETDASGTLHAICEKIRFSPADLEVPIPDIEVTNGRIYYSTNGISSSDCLAQTGERCIKVEKAIVSSSDTSKAKVNSREWIKIKVEQPLLGFFNYKKRISNAGCGDSNILGRTATLK